MHQNYTSWVQAFAPTAIGMNNTRATTEFKNSLRRMKPRIALSVAKTVFLSDWRSILPEVLVPCTIIQSKRDPIVPNSVAYYMKRNLNGHARVKILDTGGHFPQLTAYSLQFANESSEKISCEQLAENSGFVGNKKQLSIKFFLKTFARNNSRDFCGLLIGIYREDSPFNFSVNLLMVPKIVPFGYLSINRSCLPQGLYFSGANIPTNAK